MQLLCQEQCVTDITFNLELPRKPTQMSLA